MNTETRINEYRSHRDLPSLAGVATIADAARPGMAIESCVTRLKRLHYVFLRLHGIFTARITAEPIYELKTAFSHHAYLCAEHVEAFRNRVGEMREPPLGLEVVPDANLEILLDEILAAATTEECVFGLYAVVIPGPRRGARAPHRRHEPAGRRPLSPRLPIRATGSRRHGPVRRACRCPACWGRAGRADPLMESPSP